MMLKRRAPKPNDIITITSGQSTGPKLLSEYQNGRQKEEGDTIEIVNDTKHVISVILHDPGTPSVTAVDPGQCGVYPLEKDAVRVTLSYYDNTREMKDLCTQCLFSKGRLLRVLQ